MSVLSIKDKGLFLGVFFGKGNYLKVMSLYLYNVQNVYFLSGIT